MPVAHLPDVPTGARVSLPVPWSVMSHSMLVDGGVGALTQPLHSVDASIGCDQTTVMMSPLFTLPAVWPALLVRVTDTGNMTGVVTDEAPSCFELSVMPDAQAMPVPVTRSAATATSTD